MSFIVDRSGKKFQIEGHDQKFISSKAIVYNDEAILNDFYLLNLYRSDMNNRANPELIKQIEYRDKPTKEQIMYELGAEGLSRYDFATIEIGYRLDFYE